MGFMESFFGSSKKEEGGRANDGGNFMAIPENGPGDTTEEEVGVIEAKRLRIEELDNQIVEIENTNPSDERLKDLRDELRSLQEPVQ